MDIEPNRNRVIAEQQAQRRFNVLLFVYSAFATAIIWLRITSQASQGASITESIAAGTLTAAVVLVPAWLLCAFWSYLAEARPVFREYQVKRDLARPDAHERASARQQIEQLKAADEGWDELHAEYDVAYQNAGGVIPQQSDHDPLAESLRLLASDQRPAERPQRRRQ